MTSRAKRAGLGVAGVAVTGAVAASLLAPATASSHREAPLITEDPVADNTDVYAFVTPDNPDTVTLLGSWVPFEEPSGGPNFFKFGDDVLYEFNIDNDGDAVDDIVYQFRFKTQTVNPETFLYNTGPISYNAGTNSYDNWNLPQTYTVTRVEDGKSTVLGSDLLSPPVNVGARSTPNYEALVQPAIHQLGGTTVFAGQTRDGFYADIGAAFDLFGLRPFNQAHAIPLPKATGVDTFAPFNVHTIALEIPTAELVSSPDQPIIGVYSTTYRRAFKLFEDGDGSRPVSFGPWVQVSRLGNPLVNEVVIPLGEKDVFNSSKPADDAQFLDEVTEPEAAQLINQLYGINVPPTPRNDLVSVFLTGIEGLNQPPDVVPSEMLRLNTSIPPTPRAQVKTRGVLGGDNAGFPNGRRHFDDVVDISLRAVAGGYPLTPEFNMAPNNQLADGVFPPGDGSRYRGDFPWLGSPISGYASR